MIQIRQNQNWSLKLLAAQRQTYSEAKTLRLFRTWSAVGLGLIGLFIGTVWTESLIVVGPLGGILAFIERLIAEIERRHVVAAANMQEQFDTEVFNLPWNDLASGIKVDPEKINSGCTRFKGQKRDLLNWYAPAPGVPYPTDVLICQRANLIWDSRLRLPYAYSIYFALVLLATITLVMGIFRNLSLLQFVLIYLSPLAAFIAGLDTGIQHQRHAGEHSKN